MNIQKVFRRWIAPWLVVAFILVSCIPPDNGTGIKHSYRTSTPELLSGVLAQTLVADPQYLADCRAVWGHSLDAQQGYYGIIPGWANQEDVWKLVGDPLEVDITSEGSEWTYKGYAVEFTGGVVASVYVDDDPRILVSLRELISKYGCPDLIFAFDNSIDQPSGSYNITIFTYLSKGIGLYMGDFPVSLSDVPYLVEYSAPTSLEKYLEERPDMADSLVVAKPVSWGEAVK